MKLHQVETLAFRHEEIWTGEPWYGSNITSGLSGISAIQATHRVANQHNVAEILNHMIQWKKFVLEKLEGTNGFDIVLDSEKDWNQIDQLDDSSWSEILENFDQVSAALIIQIRSQQDTLLKEIVPGRTYSYSKLIEGIRDHDIYHLGQILILKKMATHEI